ncbi:hypothetical protein EUGRSUZ_H03080 [Eucalyptus grandis]|uniref:Uncharacterized protein n=2 Tax=Eucalyptus grandis TaxID=71139 RepID=A0ACC3JTG9_EUCGR|nr:hypothetical protein EUGRSUZ_H03080 [Eucalyptus grandis]
MASTAVTATDNRIGRLQDLRSSIAILVAKASVNGRNGGHFAMLGLVTTKSSFDSNGADIGGAYFTWLSVPILLSKR